MFLAGVALLTASQMEALRRFNAARVQTSATVWTRKGKKSLEAGRKGNRAVSVRKRKLAKFVIGGKTVNCLNPGVSAVYVVRPGESSPEKDCCW